MSNYNKITALYSRLSVGDEDRDGGESNSIQNLSLIHISIKKIARRTSKNSVDNIFTCSNTGCEKLYHSSYAHVRY